MWHKSICINLQLSICFIKRFIRFVFYFTNLNSFTINMVLNYVSKIMIMISIMSRHMVILTKFWMIIPNEGMVYFQEEVESLEGSYGYPLIILDYAQIGVIQFGDDPIMLLFLCNNYTWCRYDISHNFVLSRLFHQHIPKRTNKRVWSRLSKLSHCMLVINECRTQVHKVLISFWNNFSLNYGYRFLMKYLVGKRGSW